MGDVDDGEALCVEARGKWKSWNLLLNTAVWELKTALKKIKSVKKNRARENRHSILSSKATLH